MEARALLPQLQAGELELIAPDLVVAEFGHSLRKHVVAGDLDAAECPDLVRDFLSLNVAKTTIAPLAEEAMRLAIVHMATFYDSLYIALALRENLRVLTADSRMINAFAKLERTVHLADYKS